MPLVRGKEQSHQSLQEFYTSSNHEETKRMGNAMLLLIGKIDSFFKRTTIYGLTSLYRLLLLSSNENAAPSYVIIGSDGSNYFIDHLRSGNPNTELNLAVASAADDSERAFQLVLDAMKKSGGWDNNMELNP